MVKLTPYEQLIHEVEHRASLARKRAWRVPRAERQAFVYDATFRNEFEAVAYPLARRIGRIPDFLNPTTYSEKLRSLFLTHPNPLMSLAADKIEMRKYCDMLDVPSRPPELLQAHKNPQELDLASLPEAAIIKISDGCKMSITHLPGMLLTPLAYRRFLRQMWPIAHWRRHAELHYRDIPRRVLVERLIQPFNGLGETGIHCAMGQPYLARAAQPSVHLAGSRLRGTGEGRRQGAVANLSIPARAISRGNAGNGPAHRCPVPALPRRLHVQYFALLSGRDHALALRLLRSAQNTRSRGGAWRAL